MNHVGKEIGILKVAQDAQVDGHTKSEQCPAFPLNLVLVDGLRYKKVGASDQHEQANKQSTCLIVEEQTDEEQIGIAQ